MKKCFDTLVAINHLSKEQLEEAEFQLAVCEDSDWFWWFGDYNSDQAVSSFEKQFRLNLSHLYHLLGEHAPAHLSLLFTQGLGDPVMGGTVLKGTD